MSATTWLIIAIVGFSLSGIALVVAIFMFIKMDIPAVIGDLTGKTVAREIQARRDANAASGNKIHKSSSVNANRGKLTEKVKDEGTVGSARAVAHASKRLDETGTGQSTHLPKAGNSEQISSTQSKERTTESLSINVNEVNIEERRATAVLSQNRVTDILGEDKKTDILCATPDTAVLIETRQTEVLSASNQTEVLTGQERSVGGEAGTTVLNVNDEGISEELKPVAFKVTRSIIKIHTDEVI